MKIRCEQSQVSRALQACLGAVAPRGTIPILGCVCLMAEEETLTVTGTDLEIAVQIRIPAEVQEKGSICVPARRLADFIKESPSAPVDLHAPEPEKVQVKVGRARLSLPAYERTKFPEFPPVSPVLRTLSVEGSILKDMFRKTAFAIATDETRYHLNGVYFCAEKTRLRLVATDGRRLACATRPLPVASGGKQEKEKIREDQPVAVIMPRKAVEEFLRVFHPDPERVEVSIGQNQMILETKDARLQTRLVDGTFPNYEQVIPKECLIKVTLSAEELEHATRQVVASSDRDPSVRISLKEGRMILTSQDPSGAQAEDELEVEYKGQPLEAAYNPAYLLDFLKNAGSDHIVLEMNNGLSPALMRPAGDGQSYLCVVMPKKW